MEIPMIEPAPDDEGVSVIKDVDRVKPQASPDPEPVAQT
jgi:hypothetical protein